MNDAIYALPVCPKFSIGQKRVGRALSKLVKTGTHKDIRKESPC